MNSAPMHPSVVALSVVSSSNTRDSFQLRPEHSVFIGSSGNCGLPLRGEGVSDIHCYVRFEDGKLWVEDWMSRSGTLVNGEPITTRVEVQLGDTIQVGSHQIALQDAAQSTLSSVLKPDKAPAAIIDDASGKNANASHVVEPLTNISDTPVTSEPGGCDGVDEAVSWPSTDFGVEGFDVSVLEADEDETYDKETVALLRAEIEYLQAALAQRDARVTHERDDDIETAAAGRVAIDDPTDPVLARMQELIEEADRSDERVAMLEELLLAAEVAYGAEQEERVQLEAWINDIEQRLAQREAERQAEVELLHARLAQAARMQERLVQQLRQAVGNQAVPLNYHEHLEQLQQDYQKLQHELAESQQQCAKLQQRLSQVAEEPQRALCEERVRLAEEKKSVAKLKLELSSKLSMLGTSAALDNRVDTDADQRIKALRDHLLQIHEQEQQAARATSLSGRLKRLWQRVDG